MKARAYLITLAAALCANPASGAVRRDILRRDLAETTTPTGAPSTPSTSSGPPPDGDDDGSGNRIASHPISSTALENASKEVSVSSVPSESYDAGPAPETTTGADAIVPCGQDDAEPCTSTSTTSQERSEDPDPSHTTTVPEESSSYSTPPLENTWTTSTETTESPEITEPYTPSKTKTSGAAWRTIPDPVTEPTTTSSSCVALPTDVPLTVTRITHSSTTTFYGDPRDYTPPFPTISTTNYCRPTIAPGVPDHIVITQTRDRSKGAPVYSTIYISSITFYTTDKNPSVVFSTHPVPGFGSGDDDDGSIAKTRAPGLRGRPQVIVTAGPEEVTIGPSTVRGLKPGQTKTVVVGDESFTIFPTAVVGQGVTIEKPAPVTPKGAPPPSPTTAVLGDLLATASGSEVVIEGDTLTIPPHGGSMITQGETITFKPGTAIIEGNTLTWDPGNIEATDVLVLGGELITAAGPSELIVRSSTLTYGSDIKKSHTWVDRDQIILDSSGVVVQWRTLGGPNAGPDSTTYQVVGGVTVTQMGASLMVIDGKAYTVGRSADETITTKIGNEVLTIGPDGIVIGSMTMRPDAVTVTTIGAGATASNDQPARTDASGDGDTDEDDSATLARPNFILAMVCLALGALSYA